MGVPKSSRYHRTSNTASRGFPDAPVAREPSASRVPESDDGSSSSDTSEISQGKRACWPATALTWYTGTVCKYIDKSNKL